MYYLLHCFFLCGEEADAHSGQRRVGGKWIGVGWEKKNVSLNDCFAQDIVE